MQSDCLQRLASVRPFPSQGRKPEGQEIVGIIWSHLVGQNDGQERAQDLTGCV